MLETLACLKKRVCFSGMFFVNLQGIRSTNNTILTDQKHHLVCFLVEEEVKNKEHVGWTQKEAVKNVSSRESKIPAVHYCPLVGGPPPGYGQWTPLTSQTPRTFGTLSSPRGGRLRFHEAQTICQTLIPWKSATQWTIEAQMFRQIVLLSSKYPAAPNCSISDCSKGKLFQLDLF